MCVHPLCIVTAAVKTQSVLTSSDLGYLCSACLLGKAKVVFLSLAKNKIPHSPDRLTPEAGCGGLKLHKERQDVGVFWGLSPRLAGLGPEERAVSGELKEESGL